MRLVAQFFQQCLNCSQQTRQRPLRDVPHGVRIDRRVPVDQQVSKGDHLPQVRDASCQRRIKPMKLIQRFADHFELSFNRGLYQGIDRVTVGIQVSGE